MKNLRSFLILAVAVACFSSAPAQQVPQPRKATAAQTTAGVDDTTFVTPLQLKNAPPPTSASNITSGTLPPARRPYPIGTILPSAESDGGTWLPMNGQVVSQSTYATLFSLIGHQPEFTWAWSSVLNASSNFINGVAFGNSTYVLVGKSGVVYTSANLSSWTSRTSGVATDLNAVIWDSTDSLFIAVGASNVILTSPDGTTWTSRTSGVTSTLNNVYFTGGRTVAAGTSGWITYSTNGTSWTATQPNSAPAYQHIYFTLGRWFLAPSGSNSNGTAYSTDGVTYNYVAKPTTNTQSFAGFDATYFYTFDTTTGEIWRSSDASSWSNLGYIKTSLSTGGSFQPFVFSTGVIVGMSNSVIGPVGYTSDGFTTFKPFRNSVTGIPIIGSGVVNPLADSSVGFAIAYTVSSASNVPLVFAYSVDGKNWSTDKNQFGGMPQVLGSAASVTKRWRVNGVYFVATTATAVQVLTASEPYAPSTQFQIPSRTDAAGTALYIKAL